jgi:hypothetical protein
MFDTMATPSPQHPSGAAGGVLDAATVTGWMTSLAGVGRDLSDEQRVDLLRALEELKAAASGVQGITAADLDASVRAERAARGIPAERQGRGVAAQVGLARRESPNKGAEHLALGHALAEMPHTLTGMLTGRISEWRATLIQRGTAALSREDRSTVDRLLAADPARLEGLGDRAVEAEVRKLACRLDPASLVRRARKAAGDRRVTIRPAPDTMVHLSALLPVKDGVAAYAALTKATDAATASGDGRSRGQIMADTLVARLTGDSTGSKTGVELQVVITDRALLAGDHEPAHLPGYGPLPAALVRDWLTCPEPATDHGGVSTGPTAPQEPDDPSQVAKVWLRRLYTHPGTGELVAMDSRRRLFTGTLRKLLVTRDLGTCRTPWCDAPIRHLDHVIAHHAGGPTSVTDGQGLCAACNHAKQATGWRARPRPGPDGRHIVETTTPTGHTYTSGAPPLPGTPRPGSAPPEARPRSRVEVHFHDLILTA